MNWTFMFYTAMGFLFLIVALKAIVLNGPDAAAFCAMSTACFAHAKIARKQEGK